MAGHAIFDLKSLLLAKHAQHVVLVHFPIALYITGSAFDLTGQWTKRRDLLNVGWYNLLVAAISSVPVIATGFLAWQFQLEGQHMKGILLRHLVFACVSAFMMWITAWVHYRARRCACSLPRYRIAIEIVAVVIIGLTSHLGGFLSGVNS